MSEKKKTPKGALAQNYQLVKEASELRVRERDIIGPAGVKNLRDNIAREREEAAHLQREVRRLETEKRKQREALEGRCKLLESEVRHVRELMVEALFDATELRSRNRQLRTALKAVLDVAQKNEGLLRDD